MTKRMLGVLAALTLLTLSAAAWRLEARTTARPAASTVCPSECPRDGSCSRAAMAASAQCASGSAKCPAGSAQCSATAQEHGGR